MIDSKVAWFRGAHGFENITWDLFSARMETCVFTSQCPVENLDRDTHLRQLQCVELCLHAPHTSSRL